jgi:ABC-type transporter MlaC component
MVLANFPTVAHSEAIEGDPMAIVKGTVGRVLEVLQDKQTPPQSRQRKVLEIVAPRFDFADMARSSLGYNRKKLQPDHQQQQFVPLFTAFMEEAYISTIDAYTCQKVQYIRQNSTGSDKAEVKTMVLNQRERIRRADERDSREATGIASIDRRLGGR